MKFTSFFEAFPYFHNNPNSKGHLDFLKVHKKLGKTRKFVSVDQFFHGERCSHLQKSAGQINPITFRVKDYKTFFGLWFTLLTYLFLSNFIINPAIINIKIFEVKMIFLTLEVVTRVLYWNRKIKTKYVLPWIS